MAVVEPMENSVTQSTSEGATMQGGKFKDRNLERLYKLFKLEYHKPAFFIFIIQMIWLNIGCIITSCVKYSYDVLPHIIAMVVFAVINVTLIGIFHKFRTFYRPLWISIIVLFSYSQVGVDIALSSYVLSPVTSFPWLLVVMVTLYKTLPLSAFMCGVLNGLAFLTHSLLVTLLPATEFGGVGFAIPNAIGSNALLVLCVNILGILWSLRNDQRLRKAFANSRSALSVNLLIEESTKEQERLLLSVLPKHVASEMLKDWGMEVGGQFRKIYMNRHEDVSILFADIVGFTAMSSMVTPAQLVQILNDLFANFDKLAEKFHQLRIKILGDCYYSISGCPEPRPDHAVLCIHMGLAMVTAIGEVREKTKSGVSMRVGIHTGAVLAGVLGQHRWQYDVLGKEVTFANKMESGGLPGRVHISETTASFLSGEFELEPGDGESREEAIRLAAVKTFLVKSITKPYPQGTLDDTNEKPNGYTRAENSIAQKEDGTIGKNRTKSFSKTAEPRNAMTLRFSDRDLEKTYSRSLSNDLDLALSLTGPVIVVVTSLLAQICVLPFTLSCLLTFLVPFLITGLTAVIPLALRYPKRFPKIIRKLSESAATKPTRRHVVVLVLVVAMVTSDMADLHVCAASWQSHKVENSTESIANTTYCNFPVFFCSSFLLIFIAVHLQYQISYLSRAFVLSAVTILSCIIYNTTVQSSFNDYDVILWSFRDPGNEYISSSIYFTITLTVICVFLMISSRNCENQRRRLFIFSQQLEETHLKIDVLRDKNKALVYNILPAHVAMHFTGTKRKDEDLYSQQYSEVGVIFASCPNFNDHYTEDAINNHGVEWMRLLNEIISDYDDLLNDQRFSSIVKIKTIGPTYMAASGLNLAQPADEDAPIVERWRHLADLVEFALALKESLDRINSQSFNHFMLRIGINHGPILAGVIGARKPHYDIWGNSVNVASRMESTGKLGEIQVVEETMLILKEFGFTFTQRGLVKVKGKGDLMTYFLTGRQVPPSA